MHVQALFCVRSPEVTPSLPSFGLCLTLSQNQSQLHCGPATANVPRPLCGRQLFCFSVALPCPRSHSVTILNHVILQKLLDFRHGGHRGLSSGAGYRNSGCGCCKNGALSWRLTQRQAGCKRPVEGVSGRGAIYRGNPECRHELTGVSRGREIGAARAQFQQHAAAPFREQASCRILRRSCPHCAVPGAGVESSLGLVRSKPLETLENNWRKLVRGGRIENQRDAFSLTERAETFDCLHRDLELRENHPGPANDRQT